MPVVEPLEEEQIEDELREYVQFFKGPLGVVPNSVRTMSRRPRIARAFTDLNIAVMRCDGAVTPEFKRLIGYVTSMVSGCRYCQAHTILGSERFGASEERLNGVTADHAAELREYWSDDDIVEIMAVIALFGYLNRWNDSMGSALEDLPIEAGEKYLKQFGWEVGKHK